MDVHGVKRRNDFGLIVEINGSLLKAERTRVSNDAVKERC